MDFDLLSPIGFNLSSFLKVDTQMNVIEDLIIAFTNLQLVFSSFYDPVWADCSSGPIAKLRSNSATQCGFDFIRHKFEVFFKGFRHEIVNREAGDVHQKLDTPRKCRELFISLTVVTDEMLTKRKERDFLNSHKRAYLMRIEDPEQEGIITKKSKLDKASDKGISQTSVGHSKPAVDPKKICILGIIFMITYTYMNNNQSILKIKKILADLSINRIEANNVTNNDTIENKIDSSKETLKNNESRKPPKCASAIGWPYNINFFQKQSGSFDKQNKLLRNNLLVF